MRILLDMLNKLLQTARFEDLRELASGRLLRVMPLSTVAEMGRLVLKARKDSELWNRALSDARASIESLNLPIVLDDTPDAAAVGGDGLLRLYFAQILHGSTTMIDLRTSAFDRNAWRPSRLVVDWPAEFQTALRDMYIGYYDEQDERFENGVSALGLPGTEDLFREHFGANTREVVFDLESFRSTFQRILAEADRRGHELSPWIGLLGLYLVCLYEHLEELGGGPFDVRAAFDDVRAEPPAKIDQATLDSAQT